MNQYGKLATVLVRLLAVAVATASILAFLGGLMSGRMMSSMMGVNFPAPGGRALFVPAIVNLLLAAILWAVSAPVGRLVSRDLG